MRAARRAPPGPCVAAVVLLAALSAACGKRDGPARGDGAPDLTAAPTPRDDDLCRSGDCPARLLVQIDLGIERFESLFLGQYDR